MPLDKRAYSKLPKWATRGSEGKRFETATYMGVVKDNQDPMRTGRVRVWIPDLGGQQDDINFWQTVSYASPFFGATFVGDTVATNKYTTTNHTYGMWMVPPDIGNQVLCTFVNGDPDRGYWFACVNPTLSHYMVPALAGGNKVDKETAGQEVAGSLTDGQTLPVVEFNENNDDAYTPNFYNNPKPIHEWQSKILFQQGLDKDPVRGAISSNSQRESPSHVFGISTPGRAYGNDPADDPQYSAKLADGSINAKDYEVTARKGGHSFVMDDGDSSGVDNLVRIRSAGGHQILMNDTENILYIINSTGTNWIEMRQDGTMNIYNAGSFSLRSQGDLNLYSDANVNIDSGSSINFNAATSIQQTSAQILISSTDTTLLYGASKTWIGTGNDMTLGAATLKVGTTGAITVAGSTIDLNSSAGDNDTVKKVDISPQLKQFEDAGYDGATKLWKASAGQISSIVTTLPHHEPYTRSPAATPPTPSLPSRTCEVKVGGGSVPTTYTLPEPNGNKLDLGTLRNFGKTANGSAPWTTDTAFLDKVKEVAGKLNANYIDLLAFMYNESAATYDPGIVNSIGATGLIQFMPATATGLGTTTQALAQLDRVTQMDWVLKYFNYFKFTKKCPNPKLQDLYLCVFWPAAVGQPDNYVIAAANSNVAQQNRGLRGPDGSITCASVGAVAAGKIDIVRQALANAGAPQPGQVTTGSGIGLTDGSGNPVNSGAGSVAGQDIGITQAAGKSISGTCPQTNLNKPETYTPPNGIGSGSPSFTADMARAMCAELGFFESASDYTKVVAPLIGKYQVDPYYLASAGYIKPDAIDQYTVSGVLGNSESWTNKDSITSQSAFTSNSQIQDALQFSEFVDNYAALGANGGIVPSDDICTAAGMLFVAHKYRSAELATQWRKQGFVDTPPPVVGNAGSPEEYFNHGRYAIDVLAVNALPSPADAGQPPDGTNLTGIDPAAVLSFTGSGSGTLAAFQQTGTAFQNAFLQMAQAFKTLTGQKVTVCSAYRGPEYQQAMYDAWKQAGGDINTNPTVNTARFGRLTTPTPGNPAHPDSHGSGVAIDSGAQAELINKTITLGTYGLRWGGTFTHPDRVHIQLAAWSPK
jgi:hypothetical protein